jgi:hypothetical protein
LVPAALPEPAAKQAAAGLDPAQVMAVRPGSSVSVEVNLGGAPEDVRKAVTDALTARLRANGVTAAAGQPVKLVAGESAGASREIAYQMFGQPGPLKANVTEKKLNLAFVADGKVAWQVETTAGAPMMISLKQGQTVEDAIAAHQAQAYGFFQSADLPRLVPKPREPLAFGRSELTPTGPRPAAQAGAR